MIITKRGKDENTKEITGILDRINRIFRMFTLDAEDEGEAGSQEQGAKDRGRRTKCQRSREQGARSLYQKTDDRGRMTENR